MIKREIIMTPALERLAELVRQAEAKTRARKIEGETQQAAEQFRTAELAARQAVERLRTVRPASLRAIEQADTDEHLLKDLVRKLAQFKSSLESQTDAEQLIATSQAEIERTKKQARADLEEVTREVEEARRELRTALDQYRQLRRELDRLQPELAEQFAPWTACSGTPRGISRADSFSSWPTRSMPDSMAFPALGKLEQYARLKVWIGRFRCYQAAHDRETDTSEDLQALGHRVFHQLKWLSRQYEPGYIEAFRQDYSTDWAAYVAEAQEQLVQAIEASRRGRDAESPRSRDRDRDRELAVTSDRAASLVQSSRNASGNSASASTAAVALHPSPLTQLKVLLTRVHVPDEGLDRFLEIVKQAVDDLGPGDSELIKLVLPYCQYITGNDKLGVLLRQPRADPHPERRPRGIAGRIVRRIDQPGAVASPTVKSLPQDSPTRLDEIHSWPPSSVRFLVSWSEPRRGPTCHRDIRRHGPQRGGTGPMACGQQHTRSPVQTGRRHHAALRRQCLHPRDRLCG